MVPGSPCGSSPGPFVFLSLPPVETLVMGQKEGWGRGDPLSQVEPSGRAYSPGPVRSWGSLASPCRHCVARSPTDPQAKSGPTQRWLEELLYQKYNF